MGKFTALYEFPKDLLFAVLDKDPKEPWARFTCSFNEKHGTGYSEGFLRIVRAISEYELKLVGVKCGRISPDKINAIKAAVKTEKTHKEISEFFGVSMSTVSRISRVEINLEPSQIIEMESND